MIRIQTLVLTLVVFLSFNIYAEIKISPDRNPKYNSNINPKYNSNINPKYNADINPKYNSNINPKYNLDINPKYNLDINSKYNSNINPKYNLDINPKYNLDINPKYNQSINGLYIFANNNDVIGFVVFYDGIGISFDASVNLNGYLIPHEKGFNFYNKSMVMRELWLNNSNSGYNIFDLSNVWTGYAN